MASDWKRMGPRFKPGNSGKSGQNGETVFEQGLTRAERGGRDSTARGQKDQLSAGWLKEDAAGRLGWKSNLEPDRWNH